MRISQTNFWICHASHQVYNISREEDVEPESQILYHPPAHCHTSSQRATQSKTTLYIIIGRVANSSPREAREVIREGHKMHGLPWWLISRESASSAGDTGSVPGLRRPPGEGSGHPLQHSCQGNPMDGGAWRAIGHGIVKVSDAAQRLNNNNIGYISEPSSRLGDPRAVSLKGMLCSIPDHWTRQVCKPLCCQLP